MNTVGFLLTVAREDPRFAACLAALAAAEQAGAEIFFYCLDDGITAAADPRLLDRIGPKFHLLGCAYAAEQRKLPRLPEVTYGGLKMLGDLIAHTGAFYAF